MASVKCQGFEVNEGTFRHGFPIRVNCYSINDTLCQGVHSSGQFTVGVTSGSNSGLSLLIGTDLLSDCSGIFVQCHVAAVQRGYDRCV